MKSSGRNGGYAMLLMVLITMAIAAVLWIDPGALFGGNDEQLPWNQTESFVSRKVQVPPPTDIQARFSTPMGIVTTCKKAGMDRGELYLAIDQQGRAYAIWNADYYPKKGLRYEVINAMADGNIDSQKIYEDKSGEDRSRLYVIAKGAFGLMETKEKGGQMRIVSGNLYVTGWIDPDFNIKGLVTITSDKRKFFEFRFRGQMSEEQVWQAPGGLNPFSPF